MKFWIIWEIVDREKKDSIVFVEFEVGNDERIEIIWADFYEMKK
jgi:hypothetical protein